MCGRATLTMVTSHSGATHPRAQLGAIVCSVRAAGTSRCTSMIAAHDVRSCPVTAASW
jgi:hypothetical protein